VRAGRVEGLTFQRLDLRGKKTDVNLISWRKGVRDGRGRANFTLLGKVGGSIFIALSGSNRGCERLTGLCWARNFNLEIGGTRNLSKVYCPRTKDFKERITLFLRSGNETFSGSKKRGGGVLGKDFSSCSTGGKVLGGREEVERAVEKHEDVSGESQLTKEGLP